MHMLTLSCVLFVAFVFVYDISSVNSSPTMRPAASAPCSRLPFSLLKCANSTFCLEDDHRTCVSGAINVPSDNSSSRTRTYLLAARHNAAYALQQIDSLSLTWQTLRSSTRPGDRCEDLERLFGTCTASTFNKTAAGTLAADQSCFVIRFHKLQLFYGDMYGLDNYAYYEEKLRQYLYDSVNKVMCALNGLAAKCGQRQSVCEYIAKRMNITTGSTLERERGQQCVHREAQHLFLEYQSFLKSVDAYKSCESQ